MLSAREGHLKVVKRLRLILDIAKRRLPAVKWFWDRCRGCGDLAVAPS